MVGRILKVISLTLCLGLICLMVSHAKNAQSKVRMVVSSTIYVSGDLVNLQLLTLDEANKLLYDGDLINLYLVANDGQTVSYERFNSARQEFGYAFLLPNELPTGNYKLVAHITGSEFQTEAIIHVYSPTIFSSTLLPKNANPELGLPAIPTLIVDDSIDLKVQETTFSINSKSASSGVLALKIYDPLLEGAPILGTVKRSEISLESSPKFVLNPISNDPDSRISVFFLDQGIVEEYSLRDSLEIEGKLVRHLGSSSVWSYQFDNIGHAIGEVSIDLGQIQNITFNSFENIVPFDATVVSLLDHKRKRKYINQIYGIDFDNYESIWEESTHSLPDLVYLNKDYEGIATLREAFSSIVSKAAVKRNKEVYELRLSPSNAGFRYEESPLILFNGSPIFALGELMETPFHQIKSISVYNSIQSLNRFGVLGRFGVVSIELKEEFDAPFLVEKEAYPFYQGINELVQVEDELDPAFPDLRPVLMWVSSEYIQQDQTRTFDWKASDVAGNYIVWVDILNNDGTSLQGSQLLSGTLAK
jgi:hypothetical protein